MKMCCLTVVCRHGGRCVEIAVVVRRASRGRPAGDVSGEVRSQEDRKTLTQSVRTASSESPSHRPFAGLPEVDCLLPSPAGILGYCTCVGDALRQIVSLMKRKTLSRPRETAEYRFHYFHVTIDCSIEAIAMEKLGEAEQLRSSRFHAVALPPRLDAYVN